jgi:parvulin-like peptidyl-prolyl isomerase
MRWQLLIVWSAWTVAATAAGCAGNQPLLTPEAREALARPGREPAPTVARSQKGETVAYLDPLPDAPNPGSEGRLAASIRAVVNNVPIFDEEVQATSYQFLMAIREYPEPEYSRRKREIEKEMLDQLIDRELLLQDAEARLKKAGPKILERFKKDANKEFDRRWVREMKRGNHIKTDAEFKELLARQGLSLEMIRRQWVRQFMATEYLRQRIKPYVERPSHEQMLDYYEQHQSEFKVEDAIEWQDLFISVQNSKYKNTAEARKAAEDLVRRLRDGADFVALCERYDDGLSHDKGAKGEGTRRGAIRPEELEDPLFRMRAGEVGPVVGVGSGFHVFRLIKRDYAGVKPFAEEEVQRTIRNKLRGEASVRESKQMIRKLRGKAVIEYARPKF